MLKKDSKTNKILSNYKKYLYQCDKIRYSEKPPNLSTLQRTIRPFCRTTLLNNSILSFHLKGLNTTVSIMVIAKEYDAYYFLIKSNEKRSFEYTISCLSIKELMYKINYKYNLLHPLL